MDKSERMIEDANGVDRYLEVLDRSLNSHVITMFDRAIQDDYSVNDLVRMPDGRWLVKLTMNVDAHRRWLRKRSKVKRGGRE